MGYYLFHRILLHLVVAYQSSLDDTFGRGSEWQVLLNMLDMVDIILLKLALFSESKDYKMQRLRIVHWLQGYVQKNVKIRCIL